MCNSTSVGSCALRNNLTESRGLLQDAVVTDIAHLTDWQPRCHIRKLEK